jgi:hypothetical protein
MIVMHMVVAEFSYLGMERLNHRTKTMDAYYVGGSVVFDVDPAPAMLGISHNTTSGHQGYNAMA